MLFLFFRVFHLQRLSWWSMRKSHIKGIPTGACSGKKQPESANKFGVKGYPLAPTIDGKLAFCQWCNGVWNYWLRNSALKGALLCQLELLRMWIVVWARVNQRGSRGILRIIAGNSILTTLILISQWIIFSLWIAVWKRPIRQLSAIQLTSTILSRSEGIEFHIPGTIISNICSELIRIL